MTLFLFAIGILGLLVGSFLNVVIYRVPRSESAITGASHCPHCETHIKPWHNVPVFGWLWLRGRCASCKGHISARYPLVELGTALLFVALAAKFGASATLPAYLYLGAVAVALALIDLDTRRLPNAIVLPSYLAGFVLLAVASYDHPGLMVRAVIAMAVCFSFYFLLAFVKAGAMGFGDVKLAGVLGMYLGWLGWRQVAVGMFLGFFLGAVFGVALMLAKKAGSSSAIAFGPYMLAGALLALYVTEPLASMFLVSS